MDLGIIFLTGLTIGGISCMAVQGGLLASVIAARKDATKSTSKFESILPVIAFLVTKTIFYTILGFFLGAFGEFLSLTDSARNTLQIIAGIYMLVIGLHLLNVHPIFRYAIIQPPYFLTKRIRKESRSESIFAPGLLGAMTIFVPCGTTLAMEALAISSGSALIGAIIMFVYTVGTIPAFFGLGYLTSLLGEKFKEKFLKFAAILVLVLGLSSINGALLASGFPITLQSVLAASPVQFGGGESPEEVVVDESKFSGSIVDGKRVIDITVNARGYSPRYIAAKKGETIKLNLHSNGVYSCASAFRIPSLNIAKNLPPTGTETVEFIASKSGKIPYTCSMGMYTGTLEVI